MRKTEWLTTTLCLTHYRCQNHHKGAVVINGYSILLLTTAKMLGNVHVPKLRKRLF